MEFPACNFRLAVPPARKKGTGQKTAKIPQQDSAYKSAPGTMTALGGVLPESSDHGRQVDQKVCVDTGQNLCSLK